MTTCPRCGQPLRAPVAACPRCGQRFAPPAQPYAAGEFDGAALAWGRQAHQPQPPQTQQPPQSPYPAQPPAPGAGVYGAPQQQPPAYGQPSVRPGFSVGDLVSEEALPDWLRQASVESGQPTQRQPIPGTSPYGAPPAYPPAHQPPAPAYGAGYGAPYGGGFVPIPAEEPPVPRPDASAFPSLESAGSYQAPLAGGGGMSAGSLLDPNALPSWLTGQQGQPGADNMRGGEGMRAQSLVDDSALPEWLRNQPGSPAPAQPALPPPAVPGWGGYSASPAAPGLPAGPAAPALPPAGHAGMQQPPPSPMNGRMNGQQGFSAGQLVDPNALPGWLQAQGGTAGSPAPAAPAQGQWSASDLIDPSMLPGWVRSNDPSAPQSGAGNPAMSAMPPNPPSNAPRERTGKVPAPQGMNPGREQAERDFGASRAGTAQRGAVSRKQQAARPLGESEKPVWLREDAANGYDQGGMGPSPSGRQSRNNRSWNGYDDHDEYGEYDDYGAQYGQNGSRGQMPAGQARQPGQSWAAPDGYESSPWSRPRPTRQHEKPAAKKRKGGFFGFLRRG